ncbi:MAG: M48 family metalloprotease [Rhizobiaceae bacterium]|nr:M48 family metalloprotease [Rhizobiaceae bacterium]
MPRPDTLDLFARRRNRALNTIHTWLLAGGSLLLLAVTAWAFGGLSGVLYAVVFGTVSMVVVRRISPDMVLAMYKAKKVSAAEFPLGVGLVEDLSERAGLPAAPSLHVVPSTMMNAFAVGRRDNAAIAITDALARRLSARELAGVLAHEISHVAHEDVKVMAFADMVARFTSIMSTVGILSAVLNLGSLVGGAGEPVPWLAVLVLIAAPTVGGLLQLALSRTREFDADLGAAILTGDPDGLASALLKLERAQGRMWESMVLPGGRTPNPSVLRTHPLTEQRVERLMALKRSGTLPQDGAIAGPAATEATTRAAGRPRPSLVPRIPQTGGTYFPLPPGTSALAGDAAAGREPGNDPGNDPGIDLGRDPGGRRETGTPAGHAVFDDSLPACDGPINPPAGAPRIHLRRGGVWW